MMDRAGARVRVASIAVLLLGACGEPAPLPVGALADGASEIDSNIRSAIVELRGVVDGEPARCSGVLVDRAHVLSAAHCLPVLEGSEPAIWIDGRVYRARSTEMHPQRDVLVITLAEEADVTPIAIDERALEPADVGSEVLVAGIDGEIASRGEPWFAVQPIVEIDETRATVDGSRTRPVCAGDSGGPMLRENPAGELRVAAVLSVGALDCGGRGRYARLDVVREWLGAQL